MHNTLEALKQHTQVVVDTGDFKSIQQFLPQDATTNPSLILKAIQQPEYANLIQAIHDQHPNASLSQKTDCLLVRFGVEILKLIPGRVSTEVDARLSFDAQKTIARAKHIIQLYEQAGIQTKQRVLIKIAATWEGIQAAKYLEQEGIACNLTLLFSAIQAHACAQAQVTLISPFVGRIYDWHKTKAGIHWNEQEHSAHNDPGVLSVKRIYAYYKQNQIHTQIMGASFRNIGQVKALSGCDLLTISPTLLKELQSSNEVLPCHLNQAWAEHQPRESFSSSEAEFRYALNQDTMACEKLAEGIRLFVADTEAIEKQLIGQLSRQHNEA